MYNKKQQLNKYLSHVTLKMRNFSAIFKKSRFSDNSQTFEKKSGGNIFTLMKTT